MAFTALGILRLRDQGLLQLTDPIDKHLPWFSMEYRGRKAAITIEQLLRHTSGIPFASIGEIPVSEAESALEDTVKTLVGKRLDHQPGERFTYAAMNYNLLGLIIQHVSGQSFESYIETNVLKPLGLYHTFFFREEALPPGRSCGHRT